MSGQVSGVHTVAGDSAVRADTPAEFVEVVVTATGRRQMVPAEWVGHEVLGRGFEPVEDDVAPEPAPAPEPVSEVQLVAGDERDGSLTPAVRDAAAAASAPVPAKKTAKARKTTQSTDDTESSDETPAAGDEEN